MDSKNTESETTNAPAGSSQTHTDQDFLVVWLDANIDPLNNDYQNKITKLREVSNTVNTFTDLDGCVSFIADINDKIAFMICSGTLGETVVPVVHDMAQVSTIYIFCTNKNQHDQWTQQWSKIKGVFTDFESIYEDLKKAVQVWDPNSISINRLAMGGDATDNNLDQLDSSFMYTKLLKETLLTIDFEQQHFMEFITDCRKQFERNQAELTNIQKLEHEYRQHTPVWWYTYHCFLYSMVNSALHTMDVDLIVKLGFFIRDLHQQIARLHSQQYDGHHDSNSFVVYHEQALSQTDFDQLVKKQGGLLGFNNFLLANKIRQVALNYARETMETSDKVDVLFVMTIDPSICTIPFADVRNVSYHQNEEEILFAMHTIFRIGEMKKIDGSNRLWEVNLTLTTDTDQCLDVLTERIREEAFQHENGWHPLGELLIKMGHFTKAQQVYEMLPTQTNDDREKADIYLQLGYIKNSQGEYEESIALYEKSIEIKQKILSQTHPDLAILYSKVGSAYEDIGEYSKALSSYEKAFEINEKTLPPNHPDLATSYKNIGSVYEKMDEYSKALSPHEKAFEINQKTLPQNHPDLAMSYSNIGSVHEKMGDYSKALSSYEKAFEIYEKALPPNHPDLAAFYQKIGSVYENMGDYSKALSSHEQALKIYEISFPPGHPDLATTNQNIGQVYYNMGEYAKALSFYEKALEINQKTFPPSHPSLATSYMNIGDAYDKIGEYSKALSFYERALDNGQRSLPPDHPDLQLYKNSVETIKKKL
jgi:tetratricopeptide (TPR) repeat protein